MRNKQKNFNLAPMNSDKITSKTDDFQNKKSIKNFFKLGEVAGYFFRSKDAARPTNINLKMMHGINKISIIVFLLGIVFLLLKRLVF